MAVVRPFKCIRPNQDVADRVAALPYDVYNRKEACEVTAKEPLSFLNIDRAETQFSDDVDTYADCVYDKARQLLDERIADGTFITDDKACYYIYELTMDGRVQTGIVACSSIDDYQNEVIKKHENTRADKEVDRIRHAVWRISDDDMIKALEEAFAEIPNTYIADGHHRAASAVKVGLKRRAENPGYTGDEEFNYFLSVLFPDEQLMIMDYNRVVKDLNGLSRAEFMAKLEGLFTVEELDAQTAPAKKGEVTMFLDEKWYRLTIKPQFTSDDPVKGLDVSILQDILLSPVLGIGDPRTDKRIDFIGGIRGLKELERRVHTDMTVAFAMYPTSIAELFAVADASLLMPPKSTWFEPKLRSGLFIHRI